jgi:hypothetical protein
VAALLGDDPETLALWRKAVTPPAHRPRKSTDNISTSYKPKRHEHGTGKAYTLDRLKRERPDLFRHPTIGRAKVLTL